MSSFESADFYFHDYRGRDIPSLKGIFAWHSYYFYHLNPYKGLISEALVKGIIPEVSHPLECLESMIEILQRKENGMIWISSNWLYHNDCYGSVAGFMNEISDTLDDAAGGDVKMYEELRAKYEDAINFDKFRFEKALEKYFRGDSLEGNYWNGGYLFAASKEWKIKTQEQFNEALRVEDEHFMNVLEEFIEWFRRKGIRLGEKAEESLRRRMREFYDAYPRNVAKEWFKLLVEEDKVEPSDIYLWWGGEPNSDACYAFLTLLFEIDSNDIGTPRFDEKVSRNLRVIINISEKGNFLSSHREYEPHILKAIFS